MAKVTPLMQQYFEIREQYPDALLLFQVGDFYELFFDDAKKASAFLAIALTKRGKNNGKDIPLCGIPVHALNHYLVKLIKGGFRVAVCDQLEKPQPGKVVKRGVTQVFTPGTLTDSVMLDEKSASYIASFFPQEERWGLVFAELLTAQLFATTVPFGDYRLVESELIRFFPDEIIIPNQQHFKPIGTQLKKLGYVISFADYDVDYCHQETGAWLEKQFDAKAQQFVCKNIELQASLSHLYCYLLKNQKESLSQFSHINFYAPDDYLILDSATQRNLEIIRNNHDVSRKNSLLSVMDKAKTPMGSRMIKKWVSRPLVQKTKIVQRQQAVEVFVKHVELLQKLQDLLGSISDIERIIGRIALQRALVSDYISLKHSLKVLPFISLLLQKHRDISLINLLLEKLVDFSGLVALLDCSLHDDFCAKWIIKKGFDQKLDRLKELVEHGQIKILDLEKKEIEATGINSLKVRFNNVTGYYIEVTNPNLKLVPPHYIEQQKLVNRKRFVTQELKELEQELFRAQNEIEAYQQEVFERVKKEVLSFLPQLRSCAQAISYIDALFSLATIAYENDYVMPHFNQDRVIQIEQGRHPVVEQKLQNNFEKNDTLLDDKQSLFIITGPNMGGKSTYLRQVALICIMAQCGSFVPAKNANLHILDRVFTRIGASDNVSEGKSTFLVEMEETATICNCATKNSLVILDEVGRGTSTFDGIALAQAIIEYIFQHIEARCLFATHYHELTHLEKKFTGIKNFYMMSKKVGNHLVFLHKMSQGVASGSFGIEVAKLAQLPSVVIERSERILQKMEGLAKTVGATRVLPKQHNMFQDDLVQQVEVLRKELERYKTALNKIKSIDL